VSFRAGARRAGRTKYSLGRNLRLGLGGVVAFSRTPLRAAALAGGLVLCLGLLAGAAAVWGFLRAGKPPAGSVALAIFGLVSGAQLLFLWILGEYLGAVLEEVRARPHYIVEERINL
jgi:dolichol-phosphate mannosyltransferase